MGLVGVLIQHQSCRLPSLISKLASCSKLPCFSCRYTQIQSHSLRTRLNGPFLALYSGTINASMPLSTSIPSVHFYPPPSPVNLYPLLLPTSYIPIVDYHLLPKQPPHTPQHAVLLGVVGVLFTRDLEDGGEGGCVGVDAVADAFCDLWTVIY